MSRLRAVIVEDHPLYREGLRVALTAGEVEVVGEVTNGCDAAATVASTQPDVVLMDLHLPEMSGIDATRAILSATPEVAVIVVTMFEDDGSVVAAMRAGARGYLLKDASRVEIVRAVQAAAAGETVLGPAVAKRILTRLAAAHCGQAARPFPQLTDREHAVLDLLARGESNAAIARCLYLSQKTVRNYLSTIFMKLDVGSRSEAIVRARDAGLGGDGQRG